MLKGMHMRTFEGDAEADAVRLVNETIRDWPYSRPVDGEAVAHWKTLGASFQRENMLVAYRGGEPRAFLHGELGGNKHRDGHNVRFLAMARGAVDEGMALLEVAEGKARETGAERMVGPCFWGYRFYGGYVIGLEPYHPHWYLDGTAAFVRSGYAVGQQEVILAATLETIVPPGTVPQGYTVEDAAMEEEFGAKVFRYVAVHEGNRIATCGGRLYPRLISRRGGPIGQVGYVGTDEAHRGKGLATVLTQMALRRLAEMGGMEFLISTGLDNPAALRAYEKAGYRRMHYVMEWVKALK